MPEGKLIQVTTDQVPVNPKFVVDDSPLKASVTTILSLMFFGVTLTGAILRLASAHDLNGIRALLMRDDVIGFFVTAAPIAWAAYRAMRANLKKNEVIEITKAADNEVAMLKSEVVAATEPPPPTRAPETAIPTRLVDPIILHRGGIIHAPAGSLGGLPETGTAVRFAAGIPVTDLKPGEASANAGPAVPDYSDDAASVQDLIDRHPAPPPTEPHIPGDVLDLHNAKINKES